MPLGFYVARYINGEVAVAVTSCGGSAEEPIVEMSASTRPSAVGDSEPFTAEMSISTRASSCSREELWLLSADLFLPEPICVAPLSPMPAGFAYVEVRNYALSPR
jgi:hypothetical protein